MRKLSFFLGFLLLGLGGVNSAANAAPQVQQLDIEKSSVDFTISSPLFSGNGSFRSYSGQLELTEAGQPSAVKLKLDVSKSSIVPSTPDQIFPLPALLQSLPNPIFTFVSSSITKAKNGSYNVKGVLTRGGQRWDKTFSARLENPAKGISRIMLKTSGDFGDPGIGLPININGMDNSGSIQAKLIFAAKR